MIDASMAVCDTCKDEYDTADGYCQNCAEKAVAQKSHTPGTWTAKRENGFLRILDVNGECIACLSDTPREVANGRLIATAPELLEVAADWLNDLKAWRAGEWDNDMEGAELRITRLESLIAKEVCLGCGFIATGDNMRKHIPRNGHCSLYLLSVGIIRLCPGCGSQPNRGDTTCDNCGRKI